MRELNVLKTSLSKKLFSQELRFKDDNKNSFPEWKTKKVGEIYSFKTTNSLSRENLTFQNGDVKNIHYGDIHTKFRTLFDIIREEVPYITNSVSLEKVSEDNYLKVRDMIFADASEDLNDVGKSIEIINLNNQRVLSGLHTILARPQEGIINLGFGGYLFKSPKVRTQIQKESQGSKVLSISPTRLSNVEILIPKLEEQMKITNLLSSVDSKIDVEAQLLLRLEKQKQFLLHQLFV
ncbi:type I restriction endonuclease subunit R [Elizabethkingia anophelis]|nr:type I restriction endonuclease subunit R [Elizabethkingia anophelis]